MTRSSLEKPMRSEESWEEGSGGNRMPRTRRRARYYETHDKSDFQVSVFKISYTIYSSSRYPPLHLFKFVFPWASFSFFGFNKYTFPCNLDNLHPDNLHVLVCMLLKKHKKSQITKKYPWLIYIIFGKMYLGQLEEPGERREWKARGSWEKRGRDSHAMGKCFGETKLRERKAGHKGLWKWQTVPLTCALKEMLPLMPRRGEMIGEREWKEKEERKEKRDQGKRYSKTKRADISVHTQRNSVEEDKGEKWREGAGEVTIDEMSTTDKDISAGLWSVEQTNSKQPSKVCALWACLCTCTYTYACVRTLKGDGWLAGNCALKCSCGRGVRKRKLNLNRL